MPETAASLAGRAAPQDAPRPLVEHLAELRLRLIWSLVFLAAGTALVYGWSGLLLSWLARPVGGLVFTAPTDAFLTRLKVAVFGGFLVSLPLILHQLWLFIACALEPRARRLLGRLMPLSYALFMAGAAAAIMLVVPAAMKFLLSYGSDEVRPLLTLSAYLDFVTKLALSFGITFQLPLVLYFLAKIGVVSKEGLASRRRYAYVLSFVAAAFLTPGPDVITQLALAVPLVGLFELTLLAL